MSQGIIKQIAEVIYQESDLSEKRCRAIAEAIFKNLDMTSRLYLIDAPSYPGYDHKDDDPVVNQAWSAIASFAYKLTLYEQLAASLQMIRTLRRAGMIKEPEDGTRKDR